MSLNGRKIERTKQDLRFLRENVSIVFQDPFSSLSPRFCVGEIIAEALGQKRAKAQAQIDKALELTVDKGMHIMADSNTERFSRMAADVSASYSTGVMANGMVTDAGTSAMRIEALAQKHEMMALNDTFTDKNHNLQDMLGNNLGMNHAQVSSIMSASTPEERANRFMAATRSSALRGTFQGTSFNVNSGVDGQWNGTFSSRRAYLSGVTADAGEAYSYMSERAYGADGANTWAAIKTTGTGIKDTINTGADIYTLARRGGGAMNKFSGGLGKSPIQAGNAGGGVTSGVVPPRP